MNTLNTESCSSPAEEFQNTTLRPILKELNESLIALIFRYDHFVKKWNDSLDSNQKESLIKHLCTMDGVLKNKFIGMVIGNIPVSQLNLYFAHDKELNRRIIQMIAQRLIHQLT
jgi:hypothetical protein